MSLQELTLKLNGITAADYLGWVRDPEPPALGFGLNSISVRGEPLGDVIDVVLCWDGPPPEPRAAAAAAGLPITPEVTAVGSAASANFGSPGKGGGPNLSDRFFGTLEVSRL